MHAGSNGYPGILGPGLPMTAQRAMPNPGTLDGVSLVYFGNDWFAENRTSSHHIARRLAERFPLLYVESPGLRAPKANARDLRKVFKKLSETPKRPRQIGPQMWHMTAPQIPFRQFGLVRRLNPWIGALLVRRAMRLLGFRKPLLWFVTPDAGSLAGRLGEILRVYYCTDNYAAFPNVNRDEVAKLDRELTAKADQVFVSSPTLLEEKRSLNPATAHSPHGVDIELFSKASDLSLPVAEGARNLRRPVIGFFGLIEAWIDLDLVAYLAKARPDWTFLMIGRLAVSHPEIKSCSNVLFPGPQPYESLADWARAFDVAIIPYRRNQQVMNANPLKLREYLATGKPIVSVPTPEVDRFAHCVSIAATPDDFLRKIEECLAADPAERRAARRQAVAGMTWDRRLEDILDTVARRLA